MYRADHLRWTLPILGLAGCAAQAGTVSDGPHQDATPPSITNVAATGGLLRFTGGDVPVSATVTDDHEVAAVTIAVETPAGESAIPAIPLLARGCGTYRGTFPAPANIRAGGPPLVYRLTVIARDAAGNQARSGVMTVVVPPP